MRLWPTRWYVCRTQCGWNWTYAVLTLTPWNESVLVMLCETTNLEWQKVLLFPFPLLILLLLFLLFSLFWGLHFFFWQYVLFCFLNLCLKILLYISCKIFVCITVSVYLSNFKHLCINVCSVSVRVSNTVKPRYNQHLRPIC